MALLSPPASPTCDLFAPKSPLLYSDPFSPPSTSTLPRDAHTPEAEGFGSSSPDHLPTCHHLSLLGFGVPLPSSFLRLHLCLHLSLCLSFAGSRTPGLRQGSVTHESESADVFSAHKRICKKSHLIGTRSSEVSIALKQDGFSLGKELLATGRGHEKFGFFLLKP